MSSYRLAVDHLKKVLRDTKHIPEKQAYYTYKAHARLGIVYHKDGQFAKAEDNYRKSITWARQLKNSPKYLAVAYANLGENAMGQGKFEAAKSWLGKGLSIEGFEGFGDEVVVGTHNIYARLHNAQGNHPRAVESIKHAMGLANTKVVNTALQETIDIARDIYAKLAPQKGQRLVGLGDYAKVLALYDGQAKLKARFNQNSGANQLREIAERETAKAQAGTLITAVKSEKGAYQRVAMVVGLFLLASMGFYLHKRRRLIALQAKQRREKDWLDGIADGIEQFQGNRGQPPK